MFKKLDLLFVIVPLCIAAALLIVFTGGSGRTLVIQTETETQIVDLSAIPDGETRVIEVQGVIGVSAIEITNKGARFVQSPCPTHICTATGYITMAGQTVVCLPNRVILRISGEEVDGATG